MPMYRYGACSMLQHWRAHVLLSELVTLLHSSNILVAAITLQFHGNNACLHLRLNDSIMLLQSSNIHCGQHLPCSFWVMTHTYTCS